MKERVHGPWTNFMHWTAFGLVGVMMGFVASIMVLLEDNLTEFKRDVT
jgi:hypothetical protein